ncbi:ankyrin repeat-containing domain protein [Gongronella butleri]|nr:ankyrin repeat-containing domain protein [Gongronella butleri]
MKRPINAVADKDEALAKKRAVAEDEDDAVSALWKAITVSALDMKALYQYIKKKGDLGVVNDDGYGLIYLAARNNSMEALRLLLLTGDLDINQAHGPHQEQAIHAAASAGSYDAIELLLEHGAMVDGIDSLGHTPLSNSLFAKSVECTELLMNAKAPLDSVDQQGNSLMHLAATNQFAAVIPTLIEHGVAIDPRNHRQLTPLAIAIGLGYQDVVNALIAGGADVNGNVRFVSLLHHAIMWNRYDAVVALVDHGARVNVVNAMEESPLLVAVQQRKIDMVRYLLKKGADPCFTATATANEDDSDMAENDENDENGDAKANGTAVANANNLPLLYAANHGYTEMCALLITANTSPFFIQMAADMSQRVGMAPTASFLRNRAQQLQDAPASDAPSASTRHSSISLSTTTHDSPDLAASDTIANANHAGSVSTPNSKVFDFIQGLSDDEDGQPSSHSAVL